MSEISVNMKTEWYGAISAVSFTDSYIKKVIKIFDSVIKRGENVIRSSDIQDDICGADNTKKSDIRSTISLLKKMGFVNNVGESFSANTFFSELGRIFSLTLKAKELCTDELILLKRLNVLTSRLICLGVYNALDNKVEGSDNLRIVLHMFSKLEIVSWDEYLYALYLNYSSQKSINDIINIIIDNRNKDVGYKILKENSSTTVDDTAYSYNRNLLEQAGVIKRCSSKKSKLINHTLLTMLDI